MRARVKGGRQPWADGWEVLLASKHAQPDWNPRPTERVVRGGSGQNFPVLFNDVHAAYQLALRWKIGGEIACADKSIDIMNRWSATLKEVSGNSDRFLAAGIYGYQFANAAEIMRSYSGWKTTDFRRFQQMMLTVFYPMNHDFLENHNTAAITNYWANWDLCNIASVMAIGVLCDRRDLYDEAVDYFYHGRGNGAIDKAVYYVHPGNLGQWQESGRDQGHTTLGVALMGPICEMAWNQGDDLYGYGNHRFLAGAEYIARYNLGEDVPFQFYGWGTGQRGDRRSQDRISPNGRGALRNGYELVMNHYVNRLGIAAPYSEQYAAKLRPERGGGGHASSFDQFGFGTLTATREPEVEDPRPSGLTAHKSGNSVVLSWWGAAGATSYNIKRTTRADGVLVVATGVEGLLTYTDENLEPEHYYYTVTGVRDGEETGRSNVVEVDMATELLSRFAFDQRRGSKASNSVEDAGPGTLHGGAEWVRGVKGNAVALDGHDGYVSLPEGVVSGLGDFTVAAWVYLNENKTWMRVFDFGDDRGRYMFLTPKSDSGKVRFSVATVYNYNSQNIEGPAELPTGEWVHVAVTLRGREGKLYVNGHEAGRNPGIDFPPFRLGETPRNWIGRSQYESDPYLNGAVDELRIYDGALTPSEVAALAH